MTSLTPSFFNASSAYGLQFKASKIMPVQPTTLEGKERYLASGQVKGLGNYFAKKLVEQFGDAVFEVIENDPERLLDVPGIGKRRLDMLVKSWAEQKAVRDIMLFLQTHGVGTARALKIYRRYRERAIAIVTENPYRLSLDIEGIGFQTADAIATSLGVAKNSVMRAEAGISHELGEISQSGHCAVPEETLIDEASRLLEIDRPLVAEAVKNEKLTRRIIGETIDDAPCIFLESLHRAETGVASGLFRLTQGGLPWETLDPHDALPWIEKTTGLQLSPSQRSAVTLVLASKVSIITGGPGGRQNHHPPGDPLGTPARKGLRGALRSHRTRGQAAHRIDRHRSQDDPPPARIRSASLRLQARARQPARRLVRGS